MPANVGVNSRIIIFMTFCQPKKLTHFESLLQQGHISSFLYKRIPNWSLGRLSSQDFVSHQLLLHFFKVNHLYPRYVKSHMRWSSYRSYRMGQDSWIFSWNLVLLSVYVRRLDIFYQKQISQLSLHCMYQI